MSNKIPKDQIEREFNEARELNEYYEKEIEKLKKRISRATTAINNHLLHPWEFLHVKTIKRMLEG